VTWYTSAAGTTVGSAPTGVGASCSNIVNTAGADGQVTITATTATVAGTYYFRASYGPVTSPVASLLIRVPTVSLGVQRGILTDGVARTAYYYLTPTNLPNGTAGTITWYTSAAGTTTTGAPTGISATVPNIAGGTLNVTMNATANAVLGSYYFKVTYGAAVSAMATLAVIEDWQIVGAATISSGAAYNVGIQIASDGTPYLCYTDAINGSRATVMRFNGSSWATLGSAGFTPGAAEALSMALSPSGLPYIVFTDYADGGHVMRFNGSAWENVGNSGLGAGWIDSSSIAIAPDGTPYVALSDADRNYAGIVQKYDGSAWETVGGGDFSASASLPSLAVSPGGTPYVAAGSTVWKLDGASWAVVGAAGINGGKASGLRLAISAAGVPYIAYMDVDSIFETTVMRFDGSEWTTVGAPRFSGTEAYNHSFALAPGGTPYEAYRYSNNGPKIAVRAFDGSSWKPLGEPLPAGAYLSMAVSPSGVPYLAYVDPDYQKVTVVRFK
jgi:hypothetical protein